MKKMFLTSRQFPLSKFIFNKRKKNLKKKNSYMAIGVIFLFLSKMLEIFLSNVVFFYDFIFNKENKITKYGGVTTITHITT